MSCRPRKWTFRLRHMIEGVDKIQHYVAGMSIEEFSADPRTVDAVLRNLEIIGEAARRIPDEVVTSHPEVPWVEMRAMRNIVAHEYERVNLDTIWDTIQNDLPALTPLLQVMLEAESDG